MVTGSKKPTKAPAKRPSATPARKPEPDPRALPLAGKKVKGAKQPKAPAPALAKPTGPPLGGKPVEGGQPLPQPELAPNEKHLCWIELVKNGNVFVARSNTGGVSKEYKNRVLEDMLTELIVELQEEIQE